MGESKSRSRSFGAPPSGVGAIRGLSAPVAATLARKQPRKRSRHGLQQTQPQQPQAPQLQPHLVRALSLPVHERLPIGRQHSIA